MHPRDVLAPLAVLLARPGWRQAASCRMLPTALFFPEHGENATTAKRVCADCTVRAECLEFALATHTSEGIFGGLSPKERRHVPRR